MTPSVQGDPLSSTTELAELHDLIGGLRRCVSSLKSRYGDIRRCVASSSTPTGSSATSNYSTPTSAELDLPAPPCSNPAKRSPFPTPSTTRDFWRDVDDEGVGGHNQVLTTQPAENPGALLCVPFDETARSKRNIR